MILVPHHLATSRRQGWNYEQLQKLGSHAGEPGNRHGVQQITDAMIGYPAPLLQGEFEVGIMIAVVIEEMDGSD